MAATDKEQKFTTLISYTSAAPWTKWNPPPLQQNRQPEQPSNSQYVPMQIGAIRKATTEDEKAQHRQEGCCFKCSRKGHLVNKCPYKKKNKVLKPQSNPLEEYLKTTWHELAEEEEDEKEEPHTEVQTPDLSIESIATRTASFSPEEWEAWVHAMQSLRVDFQEAWITRPWFGQYIWTVLYLSPRSIPWNQTSLFEQVPQGLSYPH